jgi:hypothetical protein
MAAYRHPESVDPAAGLAVAEDAAVALEGLGDDLGVARARCLMCELAWMQGASERGLSEARTALRFARRDPAGTVDLDATVSVIAWALVVNRVPVAQARAECLELLTLVAGRRFAELGVRGFVAVLDAMAGDFARAREQLLRSREGLRELGLRQASIWMAVFDAEVRLLAGDPASAGDALDDAARVACEIGDRLFLATIRVERAHVLLAQDRLAEAAEAVARIDEGLAPNDLEWRPGRRVGHVRLPRRRLARPGRGGRARGGDRGGGGSPRDGADALSRQGQRRRGATARALQPSPASGRAGGRLIASSA